MYYTLIISAIYSWYRPIRSQGTRAGTKTSTGYSSVVPAPTASYPKMLSLIPKEETKTKTLCSLVLSY